VADMLAEQGFSVEVISIHTIKSVDEELVIASANKTRREEYSVIGGLVARYVMRGVRKRRHRSRRSVSTMY